MNACAEEPQLQKWNRVTPDLPAQDALVLVSGYFQGKPGAGRWLALARRVAQSFFSDETGEQLFPPTHYQEVTFPRD